MMSFSLLEYVGLPRQCWPEYDHVHSVRDYHAIRETSRSSTNVVVLQQDGERDLEDSVTMAEAEEKIGVTKLVLVSFGAPFLPHRALKDVCSRDLLRNDVWILPERD